MASDARVAISTTRLFKIGSVPGRPRQIGQVLLFGASPKRLEHAQKIFELVRSWTCTSNPITGSYLASTSGAIPTVSGADFTMQREIIALGDYLPVKMRTTVQSAGLNLRKDRKSVV